MDVRNSSCALATRLALAWALGLMALALTGGEVHAKLNKSKYDVKFGVMSMAQDRNFHVIVETKEIHRLVDPTYVHGFTVARKDGNRFIASFSIRFPAPIEVTPEVERAYLVKEGGRVIESTGEIFWGFCSMPFFFSETDPLGVYELTINVDGEELRTIRYHVVPFGNEEDPIEW